MPPPSRRLYRGYPVLHPAAGRKLFDIDAAHDASCHPAEADDQRSLLADGREYPGFGVTRDVAGDGKGAVGARALRVHHAFGDALAVEVRVLLEELPILDEERAPRTCGQGVLVVAPLNGIPAAVVRGGFFGASAISASF